MLFYLLPIAAHLFVTKVAQYVRQFMFAEICAWNRFLASFTAYKNLAQKIRGKALGYLKMGVLAAMARHFTLIFITASFAV
jgi:hypothetical protein